MKAPCGELNIRSGPTEPCAEKSGPWVLAATILGSSMDFIDGTFVNVAAPRFQSAFHATVVDVQWVIESYGLFHSSLILAGGVLKDWLGCSQRQATHSNECAEISRARNRKTP